MLCRLCLFHEVFPHSQIRANLSLFLTLHSEGEALKTDTIRAVSEYAGRMWKVNKVCTVFVWFSWVFTGVCKTRQSSLLLLSLELKGTVHLKMNILSLLSFQTNKNLFIFRTQMKIFLIRSERFERLNLH